MIFRTRTKADIEKDKATKRQRAMDGEEWFAWYPVWWDGGGAWLSTVLRKIKKCPCRSYYDGECSCPTHYRHEHGTRVYAPLTKLTVANK